MVAMRGAKLIAILSLIFAHLQQAPAIGSAGALGSQHVGPASLHLHSNPWILHLPGPAMTSTDTPYNPTKIVLVATNSVGRALVTVSRGK